MRSKGSRQSSGAQPARRSGSRSRPSSASASPQSVRAASGTSRSFGVIAAGRVGVLLLLKSEKVMVARHSSWTDQNPGRSKQRLEELRKKRDELALMGAAGVMNHIADIADEKAGGHRDAAMLRSLARHCRTRAGRGIAGVDDGDAVDSGGLPTGHQDLAKDAGTDTPSHEKGMASGESMMRAHRAVLTDPRLGGVQDECCGAVTVIVGAAVDMRIEVRCTQPSPAAARSIVSLARGAHAGVADAQEGVVRPAVLLVGQCRGARRRSAQFLRVDEADGRVPAHADQ